MISAFITVSKMDGAKGYRAKEKIILKPIK
jgi:hypothetical protein